MFEFYKLIVAGGRDFTDYSLLSTKLEEIRSIILEDSEYDDLEIVCGKARGADTLGETWAKENHVGIVYFPADWDKYGKSAGYIRNKEMGDYADGLIAFWDNISRGTANMISYAKEKKLNVFIVYYTQ